MHSRLVPSLLWLGALVAAHPAVVRAQDLPYDNYLVGERALGLGGAFTGLADDPSATFHNPAGLAWVDRVAVSTSFWLVAWHERALENGWRTPDGAAQLSDDRISSPPLVVTAVARLGPLDERGLKRHAIGMAIIKPLRVDYRLDAAMDQGLGPDALASLDVVHRDNARWYGASYAYGPTRDMWSVGVSGFLTIRTISHEEFELHGQAGAPTPSPGGYEISRHSLFHASLWHAVLRLGAMYTPSPRWRVGAMLQVPGMRLYSSAENRQETFDIDAAGQTVSQRDVRQGMRANRPIPWELRVGATYVPARRALITADISVHGGAGTEDAPIRLVDDATMPRSRFLVMEAHMDTSVRAAVGAEFLASRRVPLRTGFFAYRSGVPKVPAIWDRVSASDMHTLGGSVSAGVIMGDGHELSFGLACLHGWGTGAALDQSVLDQPSYVAMPASETQVLVFIAGGRRAAKTLAKSLARKSERWLLR